MYILTYKIYLEEKLHKIMIFMWNDWPINTTGSNWSTGLGRRLEFDHVALHKHNMIKLCYFAKSFEPLSIHQFFLSYYANFTKTNPRNYKKRLLT